MFNGVVTDTNIVMYLMIAVGVIGVLAKVMNQITLRRMVKAAGNMSKSTHKLMKLVLLLNMLSRLVITFLPRSKRLLISWQQSPSAVILEPKKNNNKVSHYFDFSPSIFHEVMGPDAMIFAF